MSTGVVDTLSEALDAAARVDVDALDEAGLDAELVGLLRAQHRLAAEVARRVQRWDRAGVWMGDGSRSPAARLCRDGELAAGEAKRLLRRSHATCVMPYTLAAWQAGELGSDQIDRLATAAGSGRGELFARDEHVLVAECVTLRPIQAGKAIRYWTQRADAELGHDGTPPVVDPSADVRTLPDGTVTGRFVLDPIGGATVTEAVRCERQTRLLPSAHIRRIERDLYRTDKRTGVVRTKAERMAAALVEMAVRAMTPTRRGIGRSRW